MRNLLLFLPAFAFSLLFFQCAASRGSLSEAVDKSSDSHQGKRKVADTHVRDRDDDDYDQYHRRKDDNDGGGWLSLFFGNTGEESPPVSGSDVRYPPRNPELEQPYEPARPARRDTMVRADSTIRLDNRDSLRKALDNLITLYPYSSLEIITLDSSGRKRFLFSTVPKPDTAGRPAREWVADTVDDFPIPAQRTVSRFTERKYGGVRLLSGLVRSSHYGNVSGAALVYTRQARRMRRHDFLLGMAMLPTDEKSDLYGSVENLTEVQAGYDYRVYSTPDYTRMGLFLNLGVETRILFWKFKNPVYSDVYNESGEYLNTETINGDQAGSFGANIGVGWTFLRAGPMELTVSGGYGLSQYWPVTFGGFDNDVFGLESRLKAALEFTTRL